LALQYIKIGTIIFFLSLLYLSSINSENPAAGFGVVFAAIPILLSVFLIVPGTIYQLINIVKNKPKQTKIDVFTFVIGVIITLFFIGYLFMELFI
jgi:hypothetical protein